MDILNSEVAIFLKDRKSDDEFVTVFCSLLKEERAYANSCKYISAQIALQLLILQTGLRWFCDGFYPWQILRNSKRVESCVM